MFTLKKVCGITAALVQLGTIQNSVVKADITDEIVATDFKTCDERGACHRNMHYRDSILKLTEENCYLEPIYSIDPQSLVFDGSNSENENENENDDNSHVLSGFITKTFMNVEQAAEYKKDPDAYNGTWTTELTYPFHFDFSKYDDKIFRFSMDEIRSKESKPALPEQLALQRYNQTSKWAFANSNYFDKFASKDLKIKVHAEDNDLESGILNLENKFKQTFFSTKEKEILSSKYIEIIYKKNLKLEIDLDFFKIHVYYKKNLVMTINENNFLNMEQLRKISETKQKTSPLESTYRAFITDVEAKKSDTIPFGPESVALDFTFKNGITNVFGVPEHAESLRLRDTSNTEPYRLFNADTFKYTPYSTAPMYGAIPFMFGMTPTAATGVFWINAADTDISVNYNKESTLSHWISESGVLDFVIFVGDSPKDVIQSFTKLTGTLTMPPLASLGYHQCRWNYDTSEDVLTVDEQMEKNNIPYDFIWLDVEYTDKKKYFTWDDATFPDPHQLLEKLYKNKRQLVTIIDPHLKLDYFASDALTKENGVVLDRFNNPFVGECWPGESVWIDTFNPEAAKTWGGFYQDFIDDLEYHNLGFWNDMNEPSVFGGEELSFPLDNVHYGGVEHRSLHNLYGMTVHKATYDALRDIYGNETRPFLLTRSFFAGSQRSTAIWTGDNHATWRHLKASMPMIMSLNVAGMPFVGADVGGFFGDPTPELMVRWNQAGAFYPFFRGHAHIDSPRREPYLYESPYKEQMTEAIQLRYQILPMVYNEFYESHINGTPIMTPLFYKYPELEETYKIDDEFYFGGMLVKPIVEEGAVKTNVFFPSKKNIFYDFKTYELHKGGQTEEVDAPLDSIPVFIEGGHVLFKKTRLRKSSVSMKYDPYTLVVAPDLNKNAKSSLYVDDGESYDFENKDEYLKFEVSLRGKTLKSTVLHPSASFDERIEKIVVPNTSFKSAQLTVGGVKTDLKVEQIDNAIVIENPKVSINEEWTITFK